jgi:perosamine synthetase
MKHKNPPAGKIRVASPVIGQTEKRYVDDCLDSGWISSIGDYLKRFEEGFARFCGVKHAIATNNGTTAIHLALVALGIGPGDEVILPTLTYVATANAVRYCGATPVFVDCDEETLNIDVRAIADKITSRTRAIIPVHLYGHPVDMDPILELAAEHNLYVVEDAAEAHGAKYKGKVVGSIGNCATFSFYGNKILTTGEGGMVTTDDDILAAKLRLYRGQGMDPNRRYWHPVIGYNYRMTNVAAAIGCAQLERIDEALANRKRLAFWYSSGLAKIPGLVLPIQKEYAEHVYWMYTVLLPEASADKRDMVCEILDAHGVETRPVFYPMHVLPPYQEDMARYPKATACAARGINLPTHELLTQDEVAYICEHLEYAIDSISPSCSQTERNVIQLV